MTVDWDASKCRLYKDAALNDEYMHDALIQQSVPELLACWGAAHAKAYRGRKHQLGKIPEQLARDFAAKVELNPLLSSTKATAVREALLKYSLALVGMSVNY